MQDSDFRRVTCNAEVETGSIRLEEHGGRDHLVAPVVAVTEMVLKGELLPADEIANSVPAWNGRVLPIGHPTDDNGQFVSANDPEKHAQQTVGKFFDAEESDGALTGEIWVDVEKSKRRAANEADDRFVEPLAILASHADDVDAANMLAELPPALNAAENASEDDILEVSTAYYYRRQDAMGTHDGEQYEATQHDIRPDHLALLPNSAGECSAEDGCGAPRVHVHANVGAGGDGQAASASEPSEQEALTTFANSTMTENIEWLASHTKFDQDTLEGFEESHLDTLRESVEHDSDCQCGESGGTETNSNENGGDDDGGDGLPDAVQEEISALRDEVSDLRDQREAEQHSRAEEAAEKIVTHAQRFEDTEDVFETLGEDPETLEALAEEFEANAAAADFGGRVGANASPGSDDEDKSDYLDMAKQANESRFGSPEESD